jgi:hypothetical protein
MTGRFACFALLLTFLAALSPVPVLGANSEGAKLPLKRVVLFSSGVGFFEHSGQLTGDAKVELKFKPTEINDLLKSMVVRDLGGGQVSTVTYGSKDPITKTLKSFSIDLTSEPTLGQLLQQVRGERVILDAPNEISGVILGVEARKKRLNDHETIDVEMLNLVTDQGLRSVALDSVGRIKLANEQLDGELRKALAVLATAHATDKKSVELSFLGKGTRQVRVGYIQATPIWKTTYRLVLADDAKPFLQGWAIVENTSEDDWSNVELKLISGRPISFTMDLYQPLYIQRPEEQLELYSSLRPQIYGQDLGNEKKARGFARRKGEALADKAKDSEMAEMRMGLAGGAPAKPAAEPEAGWKLDQGVQSAAQAGNVGNLFQYAIATPVSLPRQQSAMLPIVNSEVKGEKVSIYNPGVHGKHPLYGLRFTNLTDLYLMQGPITVFDGGIYAGDAKIEDLPPGAERLISYGLDLATEVAQESKARPEELRSVRLSKGTLIATRKFERSTEYTVKNSGQKEKTVLIEYPFDPNWKLVAPQKPTEKTGDLYRFAVSAKPGEPAKLAVSEERIDRQQVALTNVDDGTIQFLLSTPVVSDKVKQALAELVKRKHELEAVAQHRQQIAQRIQDIGEDQGRIRQNMAQLDHNTDVYKNYVRKLNDQEAEIERLRTENQKEQERETALRKAADEFLMGLDLE